MGQRLTVWLGGFLALVLLFSLIPFVTEVTLPRTALPQLDQSNVSFCELALCDEGNPLDLKVRDVILTETEAGTSMLIEFVNKPRWDGKREILLELRTVDGNLVDMALGNMVLNDKEALAELSFSGSIAELNDLKWFLGI
jgi:hypothetical protein